VKAPRSASGNAPASASAAAAFGGAGVHPSLQRTNQRNGRALPLAAAVALVWAACAASAVHEQRLEGVRSALRNVEAHGAASCAPRELAVARSHIEFAELERAQGFPARAEAHLDVADENVRAARVLASSARCAARPDAGSPPGAGAGGSGATGY
jgi:hypothetical protein